MAYGGGTVRIDTYDIVDKPRRHQGKGRRDCKLPYASSMGLRGSGGA